MREIDENEYGQLREENKKYLGRVHPHSEKNTIYYYRVDDGQPLPSRYEILEFLSRTHSDMDDTFDVICHWACPENVAVRYPKVEDYDNNEGGRNNKC